jgi:hypothetical protein
VERGHIEGLRSALSMGVPPRREILRMIFVDREKELNELAGDLDLVTRSGMGNARLITGGAGYGKSAIIEYLKDYAFEHYNVAFSCVEMRELVGIKPSELIPAIYRALIERMEDKDGRQGRELLTNVSLMLFKSYSGKLDKILFQLEKRLTSRLRMKFEKLGDKTTSRVIASMAIDHINPVAYDYLTGIRGLEPDEARLFERVLGCRIPWRLQREKLIDALTTIARAVREAGMEALVAAIDELEVLENTKKDLLSKFLAEFTAFLEACTRAPIYIIIASTPGFWLGGERSVRALYPFLYQRLDTRRLEVGGVKEADARALAWKLIKLYERAYGRSAVEGVDGDALGSECFRKTEPPGHLRGLLQHLVNLLDEKVVKAGL